MADPPNQCAGPFGAAYDFYIERPWLMQAIGRAVWGVDISPLYRSIDRALSGVADGMTVIDVPCGGGIALRALRADAQVRFVAVDLSQKMLQRAERRAALGRLAQVEFVLADITALPFDDAAADVLLSYSGLHMIDDAERAVREISRCLRPGGALAGSTFLREGSLRQRKLFELGRRSGHALPPRLSDLRRWFDDAEIDVRIDGDAGFVVFDGRRR